MESALYGIFTLVCFVSEISLVRCAHSFDFRYFTNSWRYGIHLLVFTFDISLVRLAHSFDIDVEHSKINSISPRDHVLFSI